MAMTKCKECKNEVSTGAKTCPHCGVKDPAVGPVTLLVAFITVAGLGWFIYSAISTPSEENQATVEAGNTTGNKPDCKKDLQCWFTRNRPEASSRCEKAVEGLAKFSSKWTDSMFEPKFSHAAWSDQDQGVITFVGDKIQYQNGFGAYLNSIYRCTYDPNIKAVVAVSAAPGSLP